jgi:orotidine-5'-phosphate decarboxylase
MESKNPLIVALDVSTKERAISLVRELKDYVPIFKIGPVLFTRYGPEIVREIKGYGSGIFLDLKLYDIPNTVALTVEAMAEIGIAMFTVHIAGGEEMLKSAVATLKKTNGRSEKAPKILGVTVLTSVAGEHKEEVLERASLAKICGLDGVISSPLEVRNIREKTGENFLIVTPGIRPSGANAGDQKRIATPKEAIANGANYLVIGRPVIEAESPTEVVKNIMSEIEEA